MSQILHPFNDKTTSSFEMIDINGKPPTLRRALASGSIYMSSIAFKLLKNKQLPKGDAMSLAEVAGIQAAKQCHQDIPLCHPLSLQAANIQIILDDLEHKATVYCRVQAFASTGVEMEALSGVNGALLTLYDLLKGTDAALSIENIMLEVKEGGKQGNWVHPNAEDKWQEYVNASLQQPLSTWKVAVITLSDRVADQIYEDKSGPAAISYLETKGIVNHKLIQIPDEAHLLQDFVRQHHLKYDFILTTGGTGVGKRDISYQALAEICDKEMKGLGELMRQTGSYYTPFSWVSNNAVFVYQSCIIACLPGNPKAIAENLSGIIQYLPHLKKILDKPSDASYKATGKETTQRAEAQST